MKKTNQKGITLIALVVTIIVLLILAGVSIAMLTGQNGILTQAQNAKTKTEDKNAEEKVNIVVMSAIAQSDTVSLEIEKLKEEIEKQGGTATNNEFPLNVIMDGKNFTISSTGVVTVKENKIEIGSVISVISNENTKEEFYVLTYNPDKKIAKALAKYNLKVGANYNSNGKKIADIDKEETGYGLQDSTMKGLTSEQQRNGTIAFSSKQYWDSTYKTQENSNYPWVYNEQSNLYQYVKEYKRKLGNTDKVSEVSLPSYEDINALWPNNSQYKWLCSTSYWTGSAYSTSSSNLWIVYSDGLLDYFNSCNSDFLYGIRPVITINLSE